MKIFLSENSINKTKYTQQLIDLIAEKTALAFGRFIETGKVQRVNIVIGKNKEINQLKIIIDPNVNNHLSQIKREEGIFSIYMGKNILELVKLLQKQFSYKIKTTDKNGMKKIISFVLKNKANNISALLYNIQLKKKKAIYEDDLNLSF